MGGYGKDFCNSECVTHRPFEEEGFRPWYCSFFEKLMEKVLWKKVFG